MTESERLAREDTHRHLAQVQRLLDRHPEYALSILATLIATLTEAAKIITKRALEREAREQLS